MPTPESGLPAKLPWATRISMLQGTLTCLAIACGFIWFILQGTDKPLVQLEQHASSRPNAANPQERLVVIEVKATNLGKTPVHLLPGLLRLSQLNPEIGKSLLREVPLSDLRLAPGESDQALVTTLYLAASVQTIALQSQYSIPKTLLGIAIPWQAHYVWRNQTVIDLAPAKP